MARQKETKKPPIIPIMERAGQVKIPIRPNDFDFNDSRVLSSTFGKFEVEQSARLLIEFFQERGRWAEFTLPALIRYCKRRRKNPNSALAGLVGGWFDDGMMCFNALMNCYVVIDFDGKCCVTEAFILKASRNLKNKQVA